MTDLTLHEEIKGVMESIGRGARDGAVRDAHLGQILTYLYQKKTEKLKSTMAKLVLICGIGKRILRENYFEGLIEFGIIKIEVVQHDEVWNWVGEKAFRRNE